MFSKCNNLQIVHCFLYSHVNIVLLPEIFFLYVPMFDFVKGISLLIFFFKSILIWK